MKKETIEQQIKNIEIACIILAEAIEEGRITGITKDIRNLLGYDLQKIIKELKKTT